MREKKKDETESSKSRGIFVRIEPKLERELESVAEGVGLPSANAVARLVLEDSAGKIGDSILGIFERRLEARRGATTQKTTQP